jgi:hypothetical protein
VRNISFLSDGSIGMFIAVMYPFYAKLAERGTGVTDPAFLGWLEKQHEAAGPGNFNVGITYPLACALLVKYDNGKGFIMQERSAAGAQNAGMITASVTGGFDKEDVRKVTSLINGSALEAIDLVGGAKRELCEEMGVFDEDITSFNSSMIVYEAKLREFMYVAVVETNLTDAQVLEKARRASGRWETNKVILVRPESRNQDLDDELRKRTTPAGRIAMYAGLRGSEPGLKLLMRLGSADPAKE